MNYKLNKSFLDLKNIIKLLLRKTSRGVYFFYVILIYERGVKYS